MGQTEQSGQTEQPGQPGSSDRGAPAAPAAPTVGELAVEVLRSSSVADFFARYLPHWFTLPDAEHHIAVLARLQQAIESGRALRYVLEVFRGGGKSALISEGFTLWAVCTKWRRFPVIFSETDSQAEDHLISVIHEIETNKALRADFGIGLYREDRKRLKSERVRLGDMHLNNGVRLSARGAGAAVRGMKHVMIRPDLIILDDIQGERHEQSPKRREQLQHWLAGVIQYLGTPKTDIIAVGTPQNSEDALSYLRGLGWESARFPGEVDGASAWPERYDAEALSAMRKDSWAYAREIMLDPRESGAMFRREHFRDCVVGPDYLGAGSERHLFSECRWFQVADTALKVGKKNDYTVVGTFAVPLVPPHPLLVVDLARERVEVPKQYDFLRAAQARWPRASFMAVEDKGSGTGLIQQAALEGRPFRVLGATTDKMDRAQPLAVAAENGLLYFRAGAHWRLAAEDELLSFPAGAHDDVVDVLAYAERLRVVTTSRALPVRKHRVRGFRWERIPRTINT